jgi:hypothetical protein
MGTELQVLLLQISGSQSSFCPFRWNEKIHTSFYPLPRHVAGTAVLFQPMQPVSKPHKTASVVGLRGKFHILRGLFAVGDDA